MKNSSDVSQPTALAQVQAPRTRSQPDRCRTSNGHSGLEPVTRHSLPSDQRIVALTSLFSLLANDIRLKLLLALYDRDQIAAQPRELCVCDLATLAGASESMTSHQLRLLRDAGLVTFRRDGKFARYAIRDGPQAHLLGDALEYTSNR